MPENFKYPFIGSSEPAPSQVEVPLDPLGNQVPSGLSAFGTGFKFGFMRTPIPAMVRKLMQPSFVHEKGYSVLTDASQRYPDLVLRHPYAFVGSKSSEETDYIANELSKYEQDIAQLSQAGPFGTVGLFAGGLLDPIVLVPLVGAASKAGAAKTVSDVIKVASSAAWQTGLGAGISDYVGGVASPEHTPAETAKAVLYGAIGGALFGGAAAAWGARAYKSIERGIAEAEAGGAHKLAVNEGKTPEEAIKELVDPGGIYQPNIVTKALVKTGKIYSPVVAMMESPFETARKIQGVLSDAGMVTKTAADGKVVAEVGTIENRMHRNFGPLALALQAKDELYVKYTTGKLPEHFAPEKAGFENMKAFTNVSQKLNIHEFEKEIVKAMARGGEHEIPEVAKAARKANEALKTIGYEAEKVGFLAEGTVDAWAKSGEMYIPLSLDFGRILADPHSFVNDLLPHITPKIEEGVKNWSAKKTFKLNTLQKVKEDLSDPTKLVDKVRDLEGQSAALRKGIQEKFKAFTDLTGKPLTIGTIKQLRKLEMPKGLMVTVKDETGNLVMRPMTEAEWRKALDKTVSAIKRTDEWKEYAAKEAEISRRIKELRKFVPAPKTAERAGKTLAEAPEKAAQIVDRAALRVSKFMELKRKNLPTLARLKTEFKKLQAEMKKLEGEGLVLSEKFNKALVKAGKVLARKDAKEAALASEFWKSMEEASQEIVGRAGKRVLDLGKKVGKAERALKVDQKALEKRISELEQELQALQTEAPPFEVVTKDGKIDPTETARKFLWDIVIREGKQGPDNNPLLRLMATEERGSELARRAFKNVPQEVLLPWIHNDLSSMMRTYFRTMAGDIELYRTFGTVSTEKILKPLRDEYRSKLAAATTVKERDNITKAFQQAERNLSAEILRIRGMYGLPSNPDSWFERFGEGLLHHNIHTKLGMVLFPSLGDIPKSMIKAGPTKFVRAAIQTLVTKLRKETRGWGIKEYALSLGVTERLMATRLKQIAETADRVATAGHILNAQRWVAGKALTLTGLPALNQWMKELAIATSATFYNDAIKRLAEKGEGALTKKEFQLLLNAGIDRKMAKRIMEQVRKDPHTYWDEFGNWFENTARWDDDAARMVYESMLVGEANRAVVTPGLEKPLWADASMLGKLMYQFRGYLFSSTQKILTAGSQHPDAAFAAMVASSMVVGAASLWIRGQIIGGEFKQKMEKWTYAKWLDEAIDQSGVLGVFTEGNRFLQMFGMPALTAQWWIDGGKQYPARYAGQNVWTAMAGPSASLLTYEAGPLLGEVVSAMMDPDSEISAKVVRRIRGLSPFNNSLIFRPGFDMLEQALIEGLDLPEKRK